MFAHGGASEENTASAALNPLSAPAPVRRKRDRQDSDDLVYSSKRPRRSTELEVQTTNVMVDARSFPEVELASFEGLPTELLHIVFNYVDIKGLKSLRRINSRMNEIAISHLFSEVFLHAVDRPQNSLDFLHKRPDMGSLVRGLHYGNFIVHLPDEHIPLWRYLGDVYIFTVYQALKKAATGAPSAITQDAQELANTLKGCTANWDIRRLNSTTTVQHIDKMPRLNSLRFTGCPPDPRECDQSARTVWLRDNQYSSTICLFSTLLACYTTGRELKNLEINWDGLAMLHAWDEIYNRGSNGKFGLWGSIQLTLLESTLKNLTKFSWQMRIGELEERTDPLGNPGFFHRFLRGLPKLKELDISFRCKPIHPGMPGDRPRQILLGEIFGSVKAGTSVTLANLESLSLAGMHAEIEDLFTILENHRPTLKALQLEGIVMRNRGDWALVLSRLRRWVERAQLHSLSIRGALGEGAPAWGPEKNCRYTPGADLWAENEKVVQYLLRGGACPLVAEVNDAD
ncbi:hypothetical protein BU16DRAFT_566231 [Lophium mytilinum]|uniref:F-box domain-containing protein n=1 Tax=Lophium mytilinum TaxID=390894 RepID=A0A6A6QD55_9PEZI|nr:hypothetical protein BU16DRAFT_566231 [Lophium mytilinum]